MGIMDMGLPLSKIIWAFVEMGKDFMSVEDVDAEMWDRDPNESAPQYIAFVLYLSLGPHREKLLETFAGSFLWEMLMSGLEYMDEEIAMPLVCEIIISKLQEALNDAPDVRKGGKESARMLRFHRELRHDPRLKSRIKAMISNLEKLRVGGKIR